MASAYNSREQAACQKYFWLPLQNHNLRIEYALDPNSFVNNTLSFRLKSGFSPKISDLKHIFNFSRFSNQIKFLGAIHAKC